MIWEPTEKKRQIIYHYYEHSINRSKQNICIQDYCKDHELNETTMFRFERVLNLNKSSLYKRHIEIARELISSQEPNDYFVKKYAIKKGHLDDAVAHLKYNKIIEDIKKEKENGTYKAISINAISISSGLNATKINSTTTEPSFFALSPKQKEQIQKQEPEQELIKKATDLEISISDGIKLCISKKVDTMKMVKIIELLKDL